ncbi:hypothetical protein [Streptomyces goshikiensis]|uniref:hypothetical protein n=1 Tax=Streptomyces goshikiensis TaxID=1942 RepID=UPI00369F6E27
MRVGLHSGDDAFGERDPMVGGGWQRHGSWQPFHKRRTKHPVNTTLRPDTDTRPAQPRPSASYVKGVGKVEFAEFAAWHTREVVVMHARLRDAHNLRGFGPSDGFAGGWTSSAAPAVEELLRTGARQNTSPWDDPHSRSVEAMKVASDQGFSGTTGHTDESAGAERVMVGRPVRLRCRRDPRHTDQGRAAVAPRP